ncbi:MAG: YIP1 family protein [Sphingomonadales bacterium]|nr:MAG: YIP1 family protein [Sphingomonadales bacterium]TNF01763.1 MAG: YIP1 family protein [Sphingomonadales bacterium]
MTTSNPIETPSGLVERVKGIVLKPKEEWPVIEAESASISGLYMRYAVILAAIPALAGFVRNAFIGYGAFGFSYRPGFGLAIPMAISQYVMTLVSVAILALIADFVVTKFDGTANRLNAFKLSVYSATAAWLAGIFSAIPGLSILGLLGLYSFYLLYTGLPVLMKVPQEKAGICTAAIAVAAIVLSLIAGALLAPVAGMFGGMGMYGGMKGPGVVMEGDGGSVTVPGVGTIDTGKIEEATKKLEAISDGSADAKPVDPAQLKAMLPDMLGGYKRTSVETQSMGAGNVGGAQASARYELGDKQIRIELTDMAAVGALAGIGAALNVNQEKESDHGFERTRTVDGQMVQEEWDSEAKRGKYSTTIASRFMVSVSGEADSFDTLKAMAGSFDKAKLAALAE